MPHTKLTPELVSLVHHVELNKSGWKDRAISRLTVLAAYSAKGAVDVQKIAEWFNGNTSFHISMEDINHTSDLLIKDGTFISLGGGVFKLSESACAGVEQDIKANQDLEEYVKNKFEKIVAEKCQTLPVEDIWRKFSDGFLKPYIQEMGARAIELISGKNLDVNSNGKLTNFIEQCPNNFRSNICEAVIELIDPADVQIRSYICGLINSYFFSEVGSLSDATVSYITKSINKKIELSIFLDTNFLFSMLDLHDNPANAAAKSLLELVSELKGNFNIKLYVSPMTLEEASTVLAYYEVKLRELNTKSKLLEVASKRQEISGFTKKFIDASLKSDGKLSAKDYFAPFAKNLLSVIRSKNIELYNRKYDHYHKDQDVIDEILAQIEFEKRRGWAKQKDYTQLEHDICLMHFVRDLRPPVSENPLDAKYWISTIDYKLLGYDKFVSHTRYKDVLCMHPSTLIQMLQFWIPRTEKLEQAMVSNMRLPLLLASGFDAHAEQVTFDILSSLSSYENIDSLGEDTITRILVNEGLRQRVENSVTVEDKVEQVYEAIIEDNKNISEELANAVNIRNMIEQESLQLKDKQAKLLSEIENARIQQSIKDQAASRLLLTNTTLSNRVDELTTNVSQLTLQLEIVEKDKLLAKRMIAISKAERAFLLRHFYAPMLLLLIIVIAFKLFVQTSLGSIIVVSTIALFIFIIWIHISCLKWTKSEQLQGLSIFFYINKIRKWIYALLGTAFFAWIIWLSQEIFKNHLADKTVTIDNLHSFVVQLFSR
jgi:hypothetical protein